MQAYKEELLCKMILWNACQIYSFLGKDSMWRALGKTLSENPTAGKCFADMNPVDLGAA